MLVYDEADRFVDHQEGDRILSWCKGAALMKTAAYGHTRILAAQELEQVVGEFLLRRMTIVARDCEVRSLLRGRAIALISPVALRDIAKG
jgi:hypothetical protein